MRATAFRPDSTAAAAERLRPVGVTSARGAGSDETLSGELSRDAVATDFRPERLKGDGAVPALCLRVRLADGGIPDRIPAIRASVEAVGSGVCSRLAIIRAERRMGVPGALLRPLWQLSAGLTSTLAGSEDPSAANSSSCEADGLRLDRRLGVRNPATAGCACCCSSLPDKRFERRRPGWGTEADEEAEELWRRVRRAGRPETLPVPVGAGGSDATLSAGEADRSGSSWSSW